MSYTSFGIIIIFLNFRVELPGVECSVNVVIINEKVGMDIRWLAEPLSVPMLEYVWRALLQVET